MTLLCHQDAQLAKPHLRHLCGFSRIPFSNLNPRCYCQLPGKLNREYSGNIKWPRASGLHSSFSWAISMAGKQTEGTVEAVNCSQTSWGSGYRHMEKLLVLFLEGLNAVVPSSSSWSLLSYVWLVTMTDNHIWALAKATFNSFRGIRHPFSLKNNEFIWNQEELSKGTHVDFAVQAEHATAIWDGLIRSSRKDLNNKRDAVVSVRIGETVKRAKCGHAWTVGRTVRHEGAQGREASPAGPGPAQTGWGAGKHSTCLLEMD